MSDEKKSFLGMFYQDGELQEDKLRGGMIKWTKDRGYDSMDGGEELGYRADMDLLTSAFSDFESWIGKKTDYYDDDVKEQRDRSRIREVFEALYESHSEFRDYIDENAVKKDIGGAEVDEDEESDGQGEEDTQGFRYGELHQLGVVDEDNNINKSKMMGSMLTFAKKVDAIEAPSEEPNQREFYQAWNRFMLDRFTSDWVNLTTEKLDPGQMKSLAQELFLKSDEIEAIVEEKWEYSPDESEGNSENKKPDNLTEWSEHDVQTNDDSGNDSVVSTTGDGTNGDGSESDVGGDDDIGGSSDVSDVPVGDIPNAVFNRDSVDVIDAIASEHGKVVDAVITDVPFGQDFDPRSKDEDGIHGDSSVRKAMDINREVFKKMRMIVKKGSPVMTFAGDSCLFEMKEVMEKWYNFKQIVVWDKQHIGMSSLEDNAIRWRPRHEYIILGCNGDPRRENANRHDGSVLEFTRPHNDDRFHPTQKPEDLMRYLVESLTAEGDVIFDPFSGSGVTLDAARQTNRKYIGCEIDEEYYEQIEERLSQMTLV